MFYGARQTEGRSRISLLASLTVAIVGVLATPATRSAWSMIAVDDACACHSAHAAGHVDDEAVFPGEEWERWESPEASGFCSEGLTAVHQRLEQMSTSAMVVVRGGKIVFEYGDLSQVSYLASVRKSVLAMLYGKYVAQGIIDLDQTLEQLDINDHQELSDAERQATIRHIIAARSGVYHPASNSGDNLSSAPERGSQAPGTYYLYSNWDFNVAGTIFEITTGIDIFDALEVDLAIPLGFQDFNRRRHRKGGNLRASQHPSYHMHLSTRDMARIGYLMLRQGRWSDEQIIPRDWVQEMVTAITPLEEMNPASRRRGPFGYGYMWWVWDGRFNNGAYQGAYTGLGAVGQQITVLPALDLVVAHKTVPGDNRQVSHTQYRRLLDLLIEACLDAPGIQESGTQEVEQVQEPPRVDNDDQESLHGVKLENLLKRSSGTLSYLEQSLSDRRREICNLPLRHSGEDFRSGHETAVPRSSAHVP